MTRGLLLPVLLAGTMTGCAAIRGLTDRGPSEAEQRLELGLSAWKAGDYTTAYDQLLWVIGNHEAQPIGRQALLALTAAELDPRNPNRRMGVAASLAARYLRSESPESWVQPIAETMYLIAVEMGALEDRVAQAEAERDAADRRAARAAASRPGTAQAPPRALPTLPGRTVPDRIREVEADRDRLRQRVSQLETRLARSEQELERVRRTLRP
jgi:hypothetical protein